LGLAVTARAFRSAALGAHENSSTDDATATDNPTEANNLTALSIPLAFLPSGTKKKVLGSRPCLL
jgi:hypothetical protein